MPPRVISVRLSPGRRLRASSASAIAPAGSLSSAIALALQQQGVEVLGVLLEEFAGARFRVFETTHDQQHLRRLELRGTIVGQGVGGAHVFGIRRPEVVHPFEGLGQLVARFAELRVEPDGVGVLDDSEVVLLLGDVLVTSREMAALLRLRIAAGDGQEGQRRIARPQLGP